MKYLVLCFVLLTACGGGIHRDLQKDIKTRRGVTIKPEVGVIVSPNAQAVIESGLAATFQHAACHGYGKGVNFADYTVEVIKGENGLFQVPCAQYCGTEFDKGGYILVSGKFEPPDTIIVAEHDDATLDHMALAVQYESEHGVLYFNDRTEYARTATHTVNAGHPLLSCK